MAVEKNAAPAAEPAAEAGLNASIASLERLYQTITGSAPPPGDPIYSPIPVESDPAKFVEERLDRLVGALTAREVAPQAPARAPWAPPLAAWETDQELIVAVDVPGVERRELRVSVEGNVLTVAGERRLAANGHRLRMSERPFGSFARQIALPRPARAGELTARLRDGVLEIRLAKTSADGPGSQTIPIE